jgi:hypothetical protein
MQNAECRMSRDTISFCILHSAFCIGVSSLTVAAPFGPPARRDNLAKSRPAPASASSRPAKVNHDGNKGSCRGTASWSHEGSDPGNARLPKSCADTLGPAADGLHFDSWLFLLVRSEQKAKAPRPDSEPPPESVQIELVSQNSVDYQKNHEPWNRVSSPAAQRCERDVLSVTSPSDNFHASPACLPWESRQRGPLIATFIIFSHRRRFRWTLDRAAAMRQGRNGRRSWGRTERNQRRYAVYLCGYG